MNVSEAVAKRRTIRGFRPDPVDPELIRQIFTQAQQAPSNCNTQPWHMTVVSGPARQRLEQALMQEIMSGKPPSPVFTPGDHKLQGIYRERQVDCAVRYYGVMGIGRKDKQARNELMARNWQFFGAPHVGFLSMPTDMGPVNAIDIGIYLQTLMLLLVEHGIDSCPQGALAFFPDPVREIAGIPEGMGIVCGISFGYADEEALINTVRMPRDDLERAVTFIE